MDIKDAINEYYLNLVPRVFTSISTTTIFDINQHDLYNLTYGNKHWGVGYEDFPRFETDRFYFNEAGISFEYLKALGKPKVSGSIFPCEDQVNSTKYFGSVVGYDDKFISGLRKAVANYTCISITATQSGIIDGFEISYSVYMVNEKANIADDLENKEGPSYEDIVAGITTAPIDDSDCKNSTVNNNPFRPYPTVDCKVLNINGQTALYKYDLVMEGIGDHDHYLYSFYQPKNNTAISVAVDDGNLNELNFKVVDYIANVCEI